MNETITTGKTLEARWWRALVLVLTLGAVAIPYLNAQEKLPGRLSFVVLGHIRGSDNGKVNPLLDELLGEVRKLAPDLILLTGDMIWGDVRPAVPDAETIKQDWDRLDAALAGLGIPVYRVPGNHDIHDAVTRDIFYSRYGQLPRAFTFRGSRFLLLDSSWSPQGGEASTLKHRYLRGKQLDAQQLGFLRQELSSGQRSDHVFVFMHHLLWWHKEEAAWWRDAHPLLVGHNVRAVFGGDFGPMKFSHMRRDGIDYLQSSLEGIPSLQMLREWNSSRLLSQQFDNYFYVTVDGPEVRVEVKTVGAISTGNFTPERWRAIDDYQPPLTKRLWNVIGNPQRMIAVVLLVLGCFSAGFVAAWLLKRRPKS